MVLRRRPGPAASQRHAPYLVGMGVRITCELTEENVRRLLGEFFPATIDLDPLGSDPQRRFIRVARPTHLDFVEGHGVRVRAGADLQWSAIGFAVPVTIHELELLLVPAVTQDERGPKLVFRPTLEHADLALVPSFADAAITRRINAALAAEGDLLAWHFGESLGLTVPLPANLSPVDAMHLSAGEVTIRVQDRVIVTTLDLELSFSRRRHSDSP